MSLGKQQHTLFTIQLLQHTLQPHTQLKARHAGHRARPHSAKIVILRLARLAYLLPENSTIKLNTAFIPASEEVLDILWERGRHLRLGGLHVGMLCYGCGSSEDMGDSL